MAHPYTDAVRQYRPLKDLIPAHWHSGTVPASDGIALHYTRTGGDKPPLLLLHGVQVDGLFWLRVAQALEPEHDCILPDFRGHGKTGNLGDGLSSETMAQDMIALIEALELHNPAVIGHSMGADIACRLAAVHPLRAVVLVDPALQNFAASLPPIGDEPPPWLASLMQTMRALKTLPHEERMIAGLNMLPPGAPLWVEADYVPYVEGQAHFDPNAFRNLSELGYVVEQPDVIAQIASPILLLTAKQQMMPPQTFERGVHQFSDHWQNGRHIHFPDAGHFIPFDQFERFIGVVRNFLQEETGEE